jgi:nitroreductase
LDALETIMTRRSVRKFNSLEVSDELVEKLLRAAMQAANPGTLSSSATAPSWMPSLCFILSLKW